MAKYRILNCDSARAFLEQLSPANKQWGAGDRLGWIFRGHGDSNWKLTPAAWRQNANPLIKAAKAKWQGIADEYGWAYLREDMNRARITSALFKAVCADMQERVVEALVQSIAEKYVVYSFYEIADDLGFAIPTLPTIDFGAMAKTPGKDTGWLVASDYQEYGLPQHFGIPTRLLDWTRTPFVAAYFACESFSGCPEHEKPKQLSVWALNLIPFLAREPKYSGMRVVRLPKANNPYLAAQDGTLTVCFRPDDIFFATGKWPDLEEVLKIEVVDPESVLIRIDLPTTHVPELLRLLWRFRITRAHMRPSLENVALSVRDKLLIENR